MRDKQEQTFNIAVSKTTDNQGDNRQMYNQGDDRLMYNMPIT